MDLLIQIPNHPLVFPAFMAGISDVQFTQFEFLETLEIPATRDRYDDREYFFISPTEIME